MEHDLIDLFLAPSLIVFFSLRQETAMTDKDFIRAELLKNKEVYWQLKAKLRDGVWVVIQNEKLVAMADSQHEALANITTNCYCVCVGQEDEIACIG